MIPAIPLTTQNFFQRAGSWNLRLVVKICCTPYPMFLFLFLTTLFRVGIVCIAAWESKCSLSDSRRGDSARRRFEIEVWNDARAARPARCRTCPPRPAAQACVSLGTWARFLKRESRSRYILSSVRLSSCPTIGPSLSGPRRPLLRHSTLSRCLLPLRSPPTALPFSLPVARYCRQTVGLSLR